ncbi:MAG: hypothetical protein ABR558_06795 [Thioalkalivibrio sp.]
MDTPDPAPLGLVLGFLLERLNWDEAEMAQEAFLAAIDAEIRRLRISDGSLSQQVFYPYTLDRSPTIFLKTPRTPT